MSKLRTSSEVDVLRTRFGEPAFAVAAAALVERANRAIAEGLGPLDQAGGWGHEYYCPDHVVQLDFDPTSPHLHRCSVGGEVRRGDAFDGGWRCAWNGRVMDGLLSASTVWLATGERRYLDHVVTILRGYAEIYPDLPLYGKHVGYGRVTGQSLEEAVWAIGIVRTVDAVGDDLEPADRELIQTRLLGELGRHLTEQLMGKIHNIECWHLSSLACLGVIMDDPELISLAVDGPFGLSAQFDHGIMADGWWAEGSPSYHYYMLASVLYCATALREHRPEVVAAPALRSMLTTPLTMARPDLSLPAMNDGWNSVSMPDGIAQYAALYEQGYGVWQDQRCADFLAEVYDRGTVTRSSEWALSMGPELTEHGATQPVQPQRVFPDSGYAILADAVGQSNLMIKYGIHGGGHGHPDKLELDLWAHGVRLAPDPGSPSYNSPLQGPWVRQTLSHNTALLNHRTQPEAEGRLISFLDPAEHPVGLVDAVVDWPTDPTQSSGRPGSWLKEPRHVEVPGYAGAQLRRIVLCRPGDPGTPGEGGYFVDLVLVSATEPVPIELAWHHRGRLVDPVDALSPADWSPPNETYEFLHDVRELAAAEADRAWSAAWTVEGAGTRMWGRDPVGATALVAISPSNPPAEEQGTLLRRTHGQQACFAAVLQPVADPTSAPSVAVRWGEDDLDRDGSLSLWVDHARGTDAWRIRRGDGPQTTVDQTDTTISCVLAAA